MQRWRHHTDWEGPTTTEARQEALGQVLKPLGLIQIGKVRLPLRQLLCCHHLLQKSFLHPKTHTKKGQRRNAWTVSQSVVHDLVSIEWELRDGSDEPAAEMHQNQEVFDATKKKHQ